MEIDRQNDNIELLLLVVVVVVVLLLLLLLLSLLFVVVVVVVVVYMGEQGQPIHLVTPPRDSDMQ